MISAIFKRDQRGFLLPLTFMFMLILSAAVGSLIYMASYETRVLGAQMDDTKLLYLSEAGVQRALREIRDDYLVNTQTGTAYIRGASTATSVSITNPDRMRYLAEASGNATIDNNADIAQLKTFDANYTNTRIVSVFLGVRASRATSGTGATLQVSYSTTGSFPEAGNTVLTQALPNSATIVAYSQNITADRTWTWSTIMSSNFTLRAVRTAGDRNINLDALYLIVTYEIDTGTEPWSTGSYATFPITLGAGTIQSVSFSAEQGKVHLNTASQTLLRYLMEERGVVSATANTLATNIVTYRTSNQFDSVEELQQASAMTSTIYNLIKDYVTVYSFINTNATRPTGNRAPVNINTAPREVLEAVYDDPALGLGATDSASLATDIITTRATTPFTCFYSANAAVTTDFYDFVNGRGYLTATERNAVLDNADPSLLIPVSGAAGVNGVTTEFSYDTNAFKIESLADVSGRKLRIKTILSDQGTGTFTTFVGDTTSTGYWRENFE